ncbi:hypothetical protein [Modestobacter sp. VKM Ac-2978]|uniref:hypothetical protein n=1 Tax=Modestobacter sp. VKM Ac-2978 TaxID=3004132 RepID=UPI0022AB084C|nr:hypothetical protein [Modestobacter sp. VKM Ac-2978]MCZ2847907.1 hypothetical protein [Modestobacter sp. VKM Ac-2978]
MPTADNADLDRQVHAALTELDRSLQRLHLTRADRRAIVADVRTDLQAAAADGVSPAALVGPDVDAFARETVEAGGYRPRPRGYPRLVIGGVLTAIVAVVVAYLLVVEVLTPLLASWFTLDGSYPTAGPIVAYVGIALVGLLGTFLGVARLSAGRPAARATRTRTAQLLPVGAAVGIAGAVAVAQQDLTTGATVTGQVLVVLLAIAVALGIARWWALGSAADENAAAASSVASR